MELTQKQQKLMANRIKARRESLNYTQEQFAEVIGITTGSYTKIENAFQKPSLETIIKISHNLDLTLDYIVFGKSEEPLKDITNIDLVNSIIKFSDKEKLKHATDVLTMLSRLKNL